MNLFSILLLFRKGVLCSTVIDKNDDIEKTKQVLNDLLDDFLEKYSDSIDSFSGNTRIFKDFEKFIDETLQDGMISEK